MINLFFTFFADSVSSITPIFGSKNNFYGQNWTSEKYDLGAEEEGGGFAGSLP
jgi:hypothetical protein